MMDKIKVLVVEDSPVARMLLVHILNSDPRMEVIGTANNGREAIEFIQENRPDVILMDIEMPELDGFETTRQIMETRPVPIVICGASGQARDSTVAFRIMEAGALACVEKPVGKEHRDFEAVAANLTQTVRLMSEVKVVRRWTKARRTGEAETQAAAATGSKIEIVGIGASTGGPPALQTILSALPKDFPAPIVVVQHIAAGFIGGLVEWLNQTTGLKVQVAAYGMQPVAGHVYLAPDDFQMAVRPGGHLVLSKQEPENGLRPSVDHLFRSLADVYGSRAAGVLLTGMGKDGAAELKRMRDRGAPTIAQDRQTSVVFGMPGEAVALDAASFVLATDRIAPALVALLKQA